MAMTWEQVDSDMLLEPKVTMVWAPCAVSCVLFLPHCCVAVHEERERVGCGVGCRFCRLVALQVARGVCAFQLHAVSATLLPQVTKNVVVFALSCMFAARCQRARSLGMSHAGLADLAS